MRIDDHARKCSKPDHPLPRRPDQPPRPSHPSQPSPAEASLAAAAEELSRAVADQAAAWRPSESKHPTAAHASWALVRCCVVISPIDFHRFFDSSSFLRDSSQPASQHKRLLSAEEFSSKSFLTVARFLCSSVSRCFLTAARVCGVQLQLPLRVCGSRFPLPRSSSSSCRSQWGFTVLASASTRRLTQSTFRAGWHWTSMTEITVAAATVQPA